MIHYKKYFMRNPLDWIADQVLEFFFAIFNFHQTKEERTVARRSPWYSNTQETLRFITTVGFFFIIIKSFLIQPFLVQQTSMVPTFQPFDYIIVDRFTYKFTDDPKRGEVVVFKSGPENGNRYLIKRIIGLPGEQVLVDGTSTIIINSENPSGFSLDETYVQNSDPRTKKIVILNENEYFMMGDNRPLSYDSRMIGPIRRDQIIGRTLIRLYPFSQISLFPGKVDVLSKNP
jgi:signal peptidase I